MKDISDLRHPQLRVPDVLAMLAIAVIIVLVDIVAMAESYRNLWLFAEHHQLAGFFGAIAPAVVDSFIITGELLLFVALVRDWDGWVKAYGWLLAGSGFAVSLAGNIGHVASAGWQARAMYALFPIAATAGLAAGLMILKRVTAGYRALSAGQLVTGPAAPPGSKPSREPRRRSAARRAQALEPAVRPSATSARLGRPRKMINPTPEILADIAAGKSARELHRSHPDVIPSRYAAGQLVEAHRANGHDLSWRPALAGPEDQDSPQPEGASDADS